MSAPAVGEILAGKFRIERILGEGGMGVVVVARHLVLDELVAIKFLLPQYANNREVVARFIREAKAAIRIQSQHVVRVSDVAQFESGAPYMVMELLDGCDLAKLLEQKGPLSVDDATSYVLQACEALAEAHALGIIHRDLKPPNLFLTRMRDGTPCLKVLDFGISKFIGTASAVGAAMTKTGGTMGSVLYMPPEQLDSAKHVDARTDIWALGVILYELLTGTTPFVGEHLGQIVRQIMAGQPRPVRELRPDVPAELEAVVNRCLEKNREARFASIGDFAMALLPVSPRHARTSVDRIVRLSSPHDASITAPVSSTTPKFDVPKTPSPAASTGAAPTNGNWGTTGPSAVPKRSPAIVAAIALGALVVLGGAGLGVRALLHSGGSGTSGTKVDVDEPTHAPTAATTTATTIEHAQPTETADEEKAPPDPSTTTASPTPAATLSTKATVSKPAFTATATATTTKATGTASAKASTTASAAKTVAPPPLDCTPPYTIDSDGIKHHKPGCP